jgi:hypothetical protein
MGCQMRLLTLDLHVDPPQACDIEVPLRRLASSPERLVAAQWQKLLELVQTLHEDGPYPEAWGQVLGDELYVSPENDANRVVVRVRADWRDHAPWRDGLPEMHYRLQIERSGAELSEDARARSPEEVRRIIYEAFGWST